MAHLYRVSHSQSHSQDGNEEECSPRFVDEEQHDEDSTIDGPCTDDATPHQVRGIVRR